MSGTKTSFWGNKVKQNGTDKKNFDTWKKKTKETGGFNFFGKSNAGQAPKSTGVRSMFEKHKNKSKSPIFGNPGRK